MDIRNAARSTAVENHGALDAPEAQRAPEPTMTDTATPPTSTSPATPTPRVQQALSRLDRLLAEDVAPLQAELNRQLPERPLPHLEADGAMSPLVWDARREVQRRAAAAGLYALHLPEDCGGGGFSRVEMQHVEEAVYRHGLGLHLATLAWTEGPHPILAHGSEAVRAQFLAPLVAAEMTAAFANTEPQGGSDVRGFATRARRDGDDWVLSGHKAWITNAQFCDVVVVTAVTGEAHGKPTLSAFLVEADQPGVRRGATYQTIMDDGLTGELFLDEVRVPDERRLGEVGQGMALALTYINWRRLGRGGMCAGWGAHLLERAVHRLKSRTAFGGRLGDLQAVQHLLADAHADWYSARATSLLAQEEIDRLGPFDVPLHPDVIRLVAVVKLVNDEAFFRVADRALQLHGAAGLAKGSPEETLFRIARNLKIPAGTVEIQRNAIAHQLLR